MTKFNIGDRVQYNPNDHSINSQLKGMYATVVSPKGIEENKIIGWATSKDSPFLLLDGTHNGRKYRYGSPGFLINHGPEFSPQAILEGYSID